MEVTEEMFDNWFFNSFKRYHKLQMFSVDKPIVSMELSCNSSVCLACKKPEGNGFEILNLKLPNKLYQIENEPDSINTSRDLKIKCGTLTENSLIDMKILYGKSKTILSEEGLCHVSIHEMNSHKSDQMIPLMNIDTKVYNARLAVDYTTDRLITWGHKENACHIGRVFDIENNKETLLFRDKTNNSMCSNVPYFMSSNELIVLNSENRLFDLYDLTSGRHVELINLPVDGSAKWFTNTMYTSSKETTTFNLTFVSSTGTMLIYDLRNSKVPTIYHKELFSKSNSIINITYDPSNPNKTAISGIDGNVYIIEKSGCNKSMVHKFKHEGHMFTEDYSCQNKVTSSVLWLPMCGSNTLLSAADDGSIQGWQYIE